MEKIGRFVVGLYWKQMSPDQRRDYQKLFSAATQRDWEGTPVKKFVVDKTKKTKQKDVFVRTRIVIFISILADRSHKAISP